MIAGSGLVYPLSEENMPKYRCVYVPDPYHKGSSVYSLKASETLL